METIKQQIDKVVQEGISSHQDLYYKAEKQKDYEPLLKDPTTPESIIDNIVDRITLLPLKILALKHPNISKRSQRYIIDKADRKEYLKEIVESYLSNPKNLNSENWQRIRTWMNKAQRFDICVMELLEEQNDIFTVQKLDTILNNFGKGFGSKLNLKEKDLNRYLAAVLNHKNFDVESLKGSFFKLNTFNESDISKMVSKGPNKEKIYLKFYEITNNEIWLPSDATDIFLF